MAGFEKQHTETHCRNGHPWTSETVYINPASGQKFCRLCTGKRPQRVHTATHCKNGHPWTEESLYLYANGTKACRICGREHSRTARRKRQRAEWYQSGGKERMNLARRARQYGLTPEEWDARLVEQKGVCAICGKPPSGRKTLDIDHCHRTGTVRGLLCRRCNLALGYVDDQVEVLEAMLAYLSKRAA